MALISRLKRAIALFLVSLAAVSVVNAQTSQRQPRMKAPESLKKSCDEERQFAEPWLHWARENRTVCLSNHVLPEDQTRCLAAVRQQLDALEQEHASIYLSQVKTLRQDHPVVQDMLSRLKTKAMVASHILTNGAEPITLAAGPDLCSR
jgi:hypothetical protein